MLNKDDLQAIKEIFQTNNKIFTTILKIELAETNKEIKTVKNDLKLEIQATNKQLEKVHKELKMEIGNVHQELKTEILKSEKRLEQKIDQLNYAERIEQLEQKVEKLEAIIKNLISS